MDTPWIIVISVLCTLIALFFGLVYVCYHIVFHSNRKQNKEKYPMPEIAGFEPYKDEMIKWMKQADNMEYRPVEITSFDGLKLKGKLYEYSKDAPIEILMHGYRGSARRDMSGGVIRSFMLGHSALIVDHRGSGESQGRTISFGINERRDCKAWVDFVINEINKDAKIILTGISMGAATVLMCSSMDLPSNVVGILADCGYSSPKEIIKKVIKDLKLSPSLIYPFVKLGARIYGGFKLEEYSPIEAMRECKLPVIFIHGDKDGFVPYSMSVENFNACASENKRLVIIENATHGCCFPQNREKYIEALREFFDPLTK